MKSRIAFLMTAFVAAPVMASDWPQWMGPNRNGVWTDTGLIDSFPASGPKILWRAKIAGGYAGPAVVGGKVFVFDYSTTGDVSKPNPGKRTEVEGKERLICLNAADGKEVWRHEYGCKYSVSYACGPRCTPTVSDGKVYSLGAMGDLFCLDANTGKILWTKDFKKDYNAPTPIWGFCGHPLVDGNQLICLVGGEGSVAVSFDKDTGKELWRSLSVAEQGYCPPTIIEAGGTRQLLIWHPESINALDPKTGKVYWSEKLKPNYGMSITAPQLLGEFLYASGIGEQSLMLRLAKDKPAAEVVWRGKKGNSVYCANSTPRLEGGMIYGTDSMTGAMIASKIETGERTWESFKPTTGKARAPHGTAFIVKNGDRHILMSETGNLIIAKLTPTAYEEVSRAKILEPTGTCFGRDVVWSHPAFANQCVFARNDQEIVCVSLAK